jgi:hypothetical protein
MRALLTFGLQAESFPTTKGAVSNEFVVVFSNAGGRARGKATVSTFTANATAVVVGEYRKACAGGCPHRQPP